MQLVVARLIVLSLYYFAAGGRGTRTKTNKKNQTQLLTWFIDGDNLWGSRSVPKEKTTIKEKLLDLRGSDGGYLVFDGKGRGLTENHVEATDMLQVISLAEGVTADDFIYEEIKGMLSSARDAKVQVVTADRELRRRVLGIRPRIVRNVINPVTFWRRYLPRLSGAKLPVGKDVEDDGDGE